MASLKGKLIEAETDARRLHVHIRPCTCMVLAMGSIVSQPLGGASDFPAADGPRQGQKETRDPRLKVLVVLGIGSKREVPRCKDA